MRESSHETELAQAKAPVASPRGLELDSADQQQPVWMVLTVVVG